MVFSTTPCRAATGRRRRRGPGRSCSRFSPKSSPGNGASAYAGNSRARAPTITTSRRTFAWNEIEVSAPGARSHYHSGPGDAQAMNALKRLLANGPLTAYPTRRSDQQLLLRLAAARFEPARAYSEAEVNDILAAWLDTFCAPHSIDH